MASNGYVKTCCLNCLFYEDLKYKQTCTLYYDDARADVLKPFVYEFHVNDEKKMKKFREDCEHFSSIHDARNDNRKKFGIDIYDYWA